MREGDRERERERESAREVTGGTPWRMKVERLAAFQP